MENLTGAPDEHQEYNDVTDHDELSTLITWADIHVFSRLFICYGAQFALYHKYNIKKEALPEKLFGADVVGSKDKRDLYTFNHVEYDRETLNNEYQRDVKRGLRNVSIPENYFIDNDPNRRPQFIWKSSGHLLFNNWLNHTNQETPYVLSELKKM